MTLAGATAPLTLQRLLSRVKEAVGAVRPEWITAEIGSLADRGSLYLELGESDINGKSIAKAKGVVWRSRVDFIRSKFFSATGAHLEPGLKVLLLVKPTFHEEYGLSLSIEDIDPSFTLGDFERRKRLIRDNVSRDGLSMGNKRLPLPEVVTRIAVLAPASSAGLGDFKTEADKLSAVIDIAYFSATFQGLEASESVSLAIRDIYFKNKETPFDYLFIIRGGGAKGDLAWLDDERIIRAVCKVGIPIVSGIGHERDSALIDEYAAVSVHTPSKAAQYLTNKVKNEAISFRQNLGVIDRRGFELIGQLRLRLQTLEIQPSSAARGLDTRRLSLARMNHEIQQSAISLLANASKDSAALLGVVVGTASRRIALLQSENTHRWQSIFSSAQSHLLRETQRFRAAGYEHIESGARASLQLRRSIVMDTSGIIDAHGVASVLQRGFVILRDSSGRPIPSVEALTEGATGEVHIEFRDGSATFIGSIYANKKESL